MPYEQDPIEKAITDTVGSLFGILSLLVIGGIIDASHRNTLLSRFRGKGIAVGRASNKEIAIPQTDRLKHTHVMGATGSGKTTLLVNMALQDIYATQENGKPTYGVGIIDPKGDLADRLIGHIPQDRIKVGLTQLNIR